MLSTAILVFCIWRKKRNRKRKGHQEKELLHAKKEEPELQEKLGNEIAQVHGVSKVEMDAKDYETELHAKPVIAELDGTAADRGEKKEGGKKRLTL